MRVRISILTSFLAAVLTLSSLSVNAAPKLNGMSIHTELGTEQFIAAVYATTPTSSSRELLLLDEPKTMELRVLADQLYSRRFKRMWVEGMAINAGEKNLEEQAQNLANFTDILRVKLKYGDSLKFIRSLEFGTLILLNDLELGRIEDKHFFDLLLRTWVGPVPLSSEFKQELLANGHIAVRTLERFKSTTPNPRRMASLSKALQLETEQPSDSEQGSKATEQVTDTDDQLAATNVKAPDNRPPQQTPDEPSTAPTNLPSKTDDATPKQPSETVASLPSGKNPTTAPTPTPSAPKPQKPEEVVTNEEAVFAEEYLDIEGIFEEDAEKFSADDLLGQQLYISKLTRWTSKFVEYPRASARRNEEGSVRLSVEINRAGKVLKVEVTDESSHRRLDTAAIKSVQRASPYPAVPESIKGDSFTFSMPVVYQLQ